MPTDTKHTYEPKAQSSYVLRTYPPFWAGYTETTVSSVSVLVSKRSRTYVQRRKPKGYKSPTAYASEYIQGAMYTGPFNAYVHYESGYGHYIYQGFWEVSGWNGINLSSFDESLVAKAVTKARLNLKDSHVNLAVAFAERKQTAGLVATTAKRLATGINCAYNKDIKGLKKALGMKPFITKRDRAILKTFGRKPKGSKVYPTKKAAQLFLEQRYGWVPLLSDVKGSADALAARDLASPERYLFSCKGYASSPIEDVQKANSTCAGIQCIVNSVSKGQHGAMVRLDYFKENPALAQAAALGLTNPASVAWEKVPFSFVADWFLPVGNYLNQMDADIGYQFLAGSLSKRTKQAFTQNITKRTYYAPSYGTVHAISGFGQYNGTRLVRSVYTVPPSVGFPSLKNPLSTGHVANAIALLRQAIRT